MKFVKTPLEGVFIIEPDVFGDKRGFFAETYHEPRFHEAGLKAKFVQDDISLSCRGTLRGLHYQEPHPQAKLIWVNDGEIFDVVVNIRKGSKDFGKWAGFSLSSSNHRQIYIPEGFAHGFCVLSETALLSYKCSDIYHPECEHGVIWNDPDIGIEWPLKDVNLSPRDQKFPRLKHSLPL